MKMTDEELEKWGSQEEAAIDAMPETMDKYRRAVELAETYEENDADNGALSVLSNIIFVLRDSDDPEAYGLYQRAGFALSHLCHTDNDYVAEKAGELMSELLG